MPRATHFGLHPWQGWKRPMSDRHEFSDEMQPHPHIMAALGMTPERPVAKRSREKFLHGRYEVEPNDDGQAFVVHDTRRTVFYGDLIIRCYGGGIEIEPIMEGQPFEFGSLAEFDELRDLITCLHGKAAEVAK